MLGFKSPRNGRKARLSGSLCNREKSRNTVISILECDGEKGGVNDSYDLDEERRSTIDSTMILVPMFFQGHMFLSSLRDKHRKQINSEQFLIKTCFFYVRESTFLVIDIFSNELDQLNMDV